MKPLARLTALYVLFAAISIAVNLGVQALFLRGYRGAAAIELSILVGTTAGLPVRYVLDKRHIFGFSTDSLRHDGRLFLLYTAMSVITTGLFWSVEFGFQHLFRTDAMRYLGGVLGLTLGFLLKYRLDRRYVFVGVATDAGTAAP